MNGEFGDLTDNITIIRRAFSGVASSAATRKHMSTSRMIFTEKEEEEDEEKEEKEEKVEKEEEKEEEEES